MSQEQRSNRKNKSYKLELYDPKWNVEFAVLKERLCPLFGNNLINFYHIGSTAVPGMLAKAQIDVCAVVEDLEKVTAIRQKFIELGYSAKGDYVGQGEEYFTFENKDGVRKYNIHTLQKGNPAIEGYISFREYLKAFPDAMNEYIAVKEDLRNTYGEDDYNSYDWNKGDRIAQLKRNALAWYREKHLSFLVCKCAKPSLKS